MKHFAGCLRECCDPLLARAGSADPGCRSFDDNQTWNWEGVLMQKLTTRHFYLILRDTSYAKVLCKQLFAVKHSNQILYLTNEQQTKYFFSVFIYHQYHGITSTAVC